MAALLLVALFTGSQPTCEEQGGRMKEYDCHSVFTCHGTDDGRAGVDCHFAKRCKTRCSLEGN